MLLIKIIKTAIITTLLNNRAGNLPAADFLFKNNNFVLSSRLLFKNNFFSNIVLNYLFFDKIFQRGLLIKRKKSRKI